MKLYASIGWAIVALLSAGVATPYAEDLSKKPNILFILTDDQGYGDLAKHGHPLLKTPHTDRLYDESVRFDNFYVSPSCSPTRAALLTGMHEFRNGVTHTREPREHLWTGATILPQLLSTAGYVNGFIGKWHLCSAGEYAPCNRGFDWCSTNPQGPRRHFDPDIVRNNKKTPRKGFREDIYVDEAMAFIEEADGKPWFLYFNTYSPHTPLDAPEEFIAPFRGKVTDKEATYLGMVANIDYNVGRLLDYLEEKNLDDNTLVVFMNDNGQTEGLDVYNAGMRGCKATIWHGGSRAMSFWHWPARWTPHQVDNLTAHLDVLPTLCELAGADIPADLQAELDGFSLVPLLEAEGAISWHDDRYLYQHVGRWPSGLAQDHKYAMAGVRQGNYLVIKSRCCDSEDCTTETQGFQCATLRGVKNGQRAATYTKDNAQYHWGLTDREQWAMFDVKQDPGCQNDLAAGNPERVADMVKAYDAWWDEMYPVMVARGGEEPLTSRSQYGAAVEAKEKAEAAAKDGEK